MALDRTWYNSLVDDDGSGLTGSVWDKADVDALMDATDLEIARLEAQKAALGTSHISLAPSGINHDYNPAGAADKVVWVLSPAAGTYLTGIARPATLGMQHLLINAGQPLTISNQHSASATANRITGPGYVDYVLQSWFSVWVYYAETFGYWIVLKPS